MQAKRLIVCRRCASGFTVLVWAAAVLSGTTHPGATLQAEAFQTAPKDAVLSQQPTSEEPRPEEPRPEEPRPEEPRPQGIDERQLLRLIGQLGDPERSRREAATVAIESLGIEVLPQLEAQRPFMVGETAWRLAMLRTRLAEHAVATAIEPTRVPESLAGRPVLEAFEMVFAGGGGRLPLAADIDRSLVVAGSRDAVPRTYFEQLDQILAAADCLLDFSAETPRGVLIRPRRNGDPTHVATSAGPVRLEVVGVTAVPATQPQAIRLTLRVLWEPRMQPVMLQLPMASLIVETASGEVIPPKQRAAVAEVSPRGSQATATFTTLLSLPPASVTTLASLRGTLRMWVPAAEIAVRFPVSGSPQPPPPPQTLGDLTVRLESLIASDTQLTVRLRASYPPTEALASHRTWITSRPLACDVGGLPLAVVSDRVVDRDEQGLAREAVFALPEDTPQPSLRGTVSWQLPLAIRDFPVDFLLREIPLQSTPSSSDAENREGL